jgi:DNA-binding beta-propeller fold protein YncE
MATTWKTGQKLTMTAVVLLAVILCASPCLAEKATASYLYNLSTFMEIVPYNWPKVSMDWKTNEIYVSDLAENSVSVFNQSGMEVHQFSLEEIGVIGGVAVTSEGDLLLLNYNSERTGFSILVCDFRGEPKSRLVIQNVPVEFSVKFLPDTMIFLNGRIYLADKGRMMVVVSDRNGRFVQGFDLMSLLKVEDKKRDNWEIYGFSVDAEGNLLFTVPYQFKSYKMAPDGSFVAFGSRGSSPGRFNIVSGIASDGKGHYFLTDLLRNVVMVFDRNFEFLTEFGYGGRHVGSLTAPKDLVVDASGKLYVSQAGDRGVSVFKVLFE